MKYQKVLTAITFLLVPVATVLGAPTPAYGCSCAAADLHEFADEVDLAFVGQQVSRVVHDEIADNGAVLTVEADVVYKGDVSAVVELYTNAQGSACGEDYAKNGRVAIVAFSSQGRPTVNSCVFVTEAELQQEFGEGHVPEPVVAAMVTTAGETAATAGSGDSSKWIYLGGVGLVTIFGVGLVGWRRSRSNL